MKKLDLNEISAEVLDECFGNDEVNTLEAIEVAEDTTPQYDITLKRPEGVTNEMLITDIRNNVNVKYSTEMLVRYNYGMVIDVATSCTCRIPFEDKVSYGVEGLMRAIKGYDPSKNVKFITYARNTVYMTMYNEASEANQIIHFPRYISVHNIHVNRFVDEYQKTHGRPPLPEIISQGTGIEIQHVNSCLMYRYEGIPLEANDNSEDNLSLSERITSESSDYRLSPESLVTPLSDVIIQYIDNLNPSDADLIKRIYGLGKYTTAQTLREIAELNLVDDKGNVMKSRSSVHRKYGQAMERLKKIVVSHGYEYEDF